ncbi:hypothetical protein TWF694_009931 [Orbilia ellipsospora]|uniref:FAM192A/Fyv6 N-terminal domain-containing protein n=1 Tax=Orbilia ellipsospora TaxID=2528407 RepID=A0AAV9XDA9_9PEZI
MSSGFVSSGKLDPDANTDITPNIVKNTDAEEPSIVDSWAAADAAIKAARERAASSSGLIGSQDGGKSLFEVLQANKARKQEEFEEKLKFKNQFRSLDEGEIEFLDSIVSEQRAEEEAKKKELEAQLDDFRKLQYEADHDTNTTDAGLTEESGGTWAVPGRRKRKKEKEKDNPYGANLKLRKMSDGSRRDSALPSDDVSKPGDSSSPTKETGPTQKTVSSKETPPMAKKSDANEKDKAKTPVSAKPSGGGLGGLVAYGSDSDDD